MAKLENTYNVELTPSIGTVTLSLTNKYEVIDIRTTGTITLAANVAIVHSIPSLGTLEDVHLKMRWVARVNPSSYVITIFGKAVPTDLYTKNFLIDCHYGAFGWEVKFLVDYASAFTLFKTNVANDGSSSPVSTANTSGYQVLKTLTSSEVLFKTNGDRIILRASGTCSFSANNKGIGFSVSDGTSTVAGLSCYTVFQDWWVAEAMFMATDIAAGEWKFWQNVSALNESFRESAPNTTIPAFNYGSNTWTFTIQGREGTPTGSEITVHSFTVERIRC